MASRRRSSFVIITMTVSSSSVYESSFLGILADDMVL